MDEKERQPMDETEEPALVPAEDELEAPEMDGEDAQEEESPRLYFGRFTPGVWYGGVLGIAFSYIILGLLGLINSKFSLGIDSALASPILKYGLLICLAYGLGKLGGTLEKRNKEQ